MRPRSIVDEKVHGCGSVDSCNNGSTSEDPISQPTEGVEDAPIKYEECELDENIRHVVQPAGYGTLL